VSDYFREPKKVRTRPELVKSCRMLREHNEKLKAIIKHVRKVGFEVHPSWGASDEFKDGWRECRKQVQEALEAEREQVKCEVGVWLDGDQTPLKTLLTIQKILNVL